MTFKLHGHYTLVKAPCGIVKLVSLRKDRFAVPIVEGMLLKRSNKTEDNHKCIANPRACYFKKNSPHELTHHTIGTQATLREQGMNLQAVSGS